MSLLHEQAVHFNQVVVTTHYRPWRDQYRWAKGATANTHVIELGPWTLANGLNVGSFTTAFDELKTIVAGPLSDRQAAASKAGIVLESLLDFLTLKYRCKVPRNAQNEYTLGDLAAGIDSKLAGALKVRRSGSKGAPKVETGLKSLVDEATSATWVRNSVGCHFSPLGSEVADADVVAFCKSMVKLTRELVCPFCGTTGAVAQKMGRRWIMVELGEHCHTHIIPRLKKVIDGQDAGGITEAVGWQGGGGFRYFRIAPSLLERDKWGNWVINRDYNAAMLAEALCKLEGFVYQPSDAVYWQHGHSTERDFIYVTTQHLGNEQLQQLSDEVGQERTLLVLCTAFRAKPDQYPNLTIKKIPKAVLARCEWGHDDYSLQVENLPKAPPKAGQQGLEFPE